MSVQTFEYKGDYEQVTLNKGSYFFECWGAQGGSNTTFGKGGYSSGYLSISKPLTIYVFVGGKGTYSSSNPLGDFNGGGDGLIGLKLNSCGGGGGSTDFRLNSTDLYSRFLVAGGGGGQGDFNRQGGVGGGLVGQSGRMGGTQEKGGDSIEYGSYKSEAGSFGKGGKATGISYSGGGGGSGYYGGGGSYENGGGGGSGYFSSHIIKGKLISGDMLMPQINRQKDIGNIGDGHARIVKLTNDICFITRHHEIARIKGLHLLLFIIKS